MGAAPLREWDDCGLRLVAYASESEASLPIFTRGAAAPFFHQHDGHFYN